MPLLLSVAPGAPARRVGRDAPAGSWRVLLDGTLYHRQRSARALGLADTAAADDAGFAAAALAARDAAAFDDLEGDFALVASNAADGRILAYRDFGGKRPLYHCQRDGRLLIASRVEDLLGESAVPRDLHLPHLAACASAMWCHEDRTVFSAIRELPAGSLMTWNPTHGASFTPVDLFRPEAPRRRQSLSDAAAELRLLLADAVRTRLPAEGPVAVSLSGGWDSPAVYATAQDLHRQGLGPEVRAVSISYPPGDPGREDELIDSIVAHWQSHTMYVDIAGIPLAAEWHAEAATRPLPFAHAYEHWNRRLARAARHVGAAVLLDGTGGDQLFQCSDIYLADLCRRAAIGPLARQLLARRAEPGWPRRLWQWGVRPNLPTRALDAWARLTRRPPAAHYLTRPPAPWIRRDFVVASGLLAAERDAQPPLPRRPFVTAESLAYLRFQFYPRIFSLLAGFAESEGVTLRSPLLDRELVRFALRRPWSDRVDGRETKRSLRAAMATLLPAEVLAPRPQRTGVTIAYFLRELRRSGWATMAPLLDDLRLADLGIVEPRVLRRAWEHLQRHDDGEVAVRAYFTLQTELWLRTHLS